MAQQPNDPHGDGRDDGQGGGGAMLAVVLLLLALAGLAYAFRHELGLSRAEAVTAADTAIVNVD